MRYRLLVPVSILLLATIACGGGGDTGDVAPSDQGTGGQQVTSTGLDYTLDPAFGAVSLTAGFTPDPQVVGVTSGGDVDVASLGLGTGCNGYAANAPDFRIIFAGSSNNLRIFFVADGDADATMIVNTPNGAWTCNDDAAGTRNPMVDLPNATEGQYDIWVGSYSSGEFIAGTLYITELSYTPANLP